MADATIPGGLGSFGYDDEGVPAQRVPLIVDGVFRGVHVEPRDGAGARRAPSNGTMRADGWGHLPLIRMTNINLEPGEGSLEEIIGDTADGIFMETNQSWSIDDKRVNFQFGCEIAWRIRGRQAAPSCTATRTTRGSRPSSGARATRSAGARSGTCGARRTAARASPGRPRASGTGRRRRGSGASRWGCAEVAGDRVGRDGRRRGPPRARGRAATAPGADGAEVLFFHEWGGLTRFAELAHPPEHVRGRTRRSASGSSATDAWRGARRTTSRPRARRGAAKQRPGDGRASPSRTRCSPGSRRRRTCPAEGRVRRGDGRASPRSSAPRPSRRLVGQVGDGFRAAGAVETAGARGRAGEQRGPVLLRRRTTQASAQHGGLRRGGRRRVRRVLVAPRRRDRPRGGRRRAARKAHGTARTRATVEPGTYEVVLEPAAVSTLVGVPRVHRLRRQGDRRGAVLPVGQGGAAGGRAERSRSSTTRSARTCWGCRSTSRERRSGAST